MTGSIPLARQHGHTLPLLATVGPAATYDLLCLISGALINGKAGAQLQLVFTPNNLDPLIRAGERVLVELVALSNQGQSPPLQIEISWNGQWSDDTETMSRNLVVKPYSG